MKSRFITAAIGSLFLFGTALHAQVPQLINYQGRVAVGTTNFNSPPNGLFKFALVQGTGPTLLWKNDGSAGNTEPGAAVSLPVTKGLYSVLLGDTTVPGMTQAIPASVWTNGDVRLRVWFNDGTNGSQLLTPDQRLAPTGYLPDGSVSSNAIASNAITTTKIATGAVANTQLATNAVQAANIAAGAVGSTQIGAGAVGLANIAAGAVGSIQLANGSVNAAKLASDVGLWSVAGADVFRSGGRVGIGTSPTSKLHVSALATDGSPMRLQIDGLSRFTVGSNGGTSIGALNDFPPANGLFVQGSVGIGTTSPADKLHVVGSMRLGTQSVGASFGYGLFDSSPADRGYLALAGANGAYSTDAAQGDLVLRSTTNKLLLQSGILASAIAISTMNNVGFGTPNPINSLGYPDSWKGFHSYTSGTGLGIIEGNAARLHLRADGNTANTTQDFVIDNAANQIFFRWLGAGLGGRLDVMTINASGTVSVKVLKIDGADLAEPFDIATEDAPKGAVVVIDEENPGRLKVSDRAYDRRVAGILSGANGVRSGIRLSQEGFNEGGQDVALSGRVYVHADASNGAIQPGDLLTTSNTPGHSMKVTDYARAQGAVIGKAMSSLTEGTGMVLVLVTLQ